MRVKKIEAERAKAHGIFGQNSFNPSEAEKLGRHSRLESRDFLRRKNKGLIQTQNLVEILLATSILGFVVVPFLGSAVNLSRVLLRARIKSQAIHYAREGIEISYNLALQDWDQFKAQNGSYHPTIVDGNFALELTPETDLAGKYDRVIIIKQAERNGIEQKPSEEKTGNLFKIGDPPGNSVSDPETMKVTCQVSWDNLGKPETIQFVNYFSKL